MKPCSSLSDFHRSRLRYLGLSIVEYRHIMQENLQFASEFIVKNDYLILASVLQNVIMFFSSEIV